MHRQGSAAVLGEATFAGGGWPTLSEVVEIATFRAGFNTGLVIGGTTLLGLAAGVIGVFMLLRNRALVTDALSHATLPGITIAFVLAAWAGLEARSLPVLMLGASATGVLGVVCIQLILRYSRLREDAAIGIVLSVFFGAGVVGLSYIQANAQAGSAGLKTFIYGQAATMQPPDVLFMGAIAAVAILSTMLFLKEFSLVCFNDAFARVDGWPVSVIDLLMMAMVVLVTVAGLQSVGLILVVAMLIIPAAAARFWTERLWLLVMMAGVIGALSGYAGSVLSAMLPRKPTGAIIVLTAGGLFAFSMVAAPARGVVAASAKRLRLRLRVAGDHLLELAHERSTDRITQRDIDAIARRRGWSRPLRWGVIAWLRVTGTASASPRAGGEGGLALTDRGMERGARVSRNHRLWEQYLITHADIAPSHVDWSVDQVEHVLDDELISRLERALQAGQASGGARS